MNFINSITYVNQILKSYLKPWHEDLKKQEYHPIFMQDNASIHDSAEVCLWLRTNKIEVMVWPPSSPDLNLNEYFWNHIKQKIKTYPQMMFTSGPMFKAVHQEWCTLSDCKKQLKWVATMQDRCRAVIKARGGSTKYWGIELR